MNCRRSVGAVLSTAALIAAMSPVVAFAKTTGTGITDVDDTSLTVSGLTSGDTATAYQVFDAYIDGSNVLQYKAATGLPEKYDTVEELQKSGNTGSDGAKAAADAYSKAFADGTATGVATKVEATAGADGTATFTGLDSGYWVVVVTSTSGTTKVYQPTTIDASPVEKNGAWAANTTMAQNVNQIKSEPVNVSKGVGDDFKEETDKYSVGKFVPFKVTTNVPNYPADSKDATFTIVDTPTAGLEIDTSSITVKVGETTVWVDGSATTDGASAFKTDTTKQAKGGYTFDFAKKYVLAHPGADVTVTYNAKLTSAAFSHANGDVTGNTAQVTFNPNPYSETTVTPNDKTKVYTYGFVFEKVDQKENALEGAVFTLYDKAGNVVKDENNKVITSTSKKVDGKAYVYFEDLGVGDYVAKETTVPAGKVKAADVSFSLNKDDAKFDNPATKDVIENNYLVATDKVVDGNQPLLPVTGQAGTFAITVCGVVLVGTACVIASRGSKRSE
ncbi:SpaH/EbpB family LPXTG-anchored major pilin [Olsenella porci]|uniref:Isopeptide-forming domain-containing fimbrial protein n=1 Tax=Olsenella porci TaxID=2652279 RepID=A0A6N7XGF8_9ACTN|nr:SpaH/EbpB family LPXTG-anchored major pilin [Olsenella porci]MST73363.1 isopeptide-forming domain-containing fimbrial protein [Olsenella porci]